MNEKKIVNSQVEEEYLSSRRVRLSLASIERIDRDLSISDLNRRSNNCDSSRRVLSTVELE